ncbi:ABC transporter ATP-binding protein [Gordonia caeni]|uniref:ABC transporter ATP-binding protein n=1 Tax=Gordonia caeni TaxID=1007097 RepID=A0ABP7PC13_9ACTN
MIYSDIAAITGAAGRRDRLLFVGLTVFSTVLQAASVMTLIPVLHALFGDQPSQAWPWVGLLVAQLVLAWVADGLATRAGLRLGFGLIDAIEVAGLSAIRRLDPAELHSPRASRLRDLISTAAPESISVVVLLGSPLIHALLLTPLLALMLLAVAWQLALVALAGGIAMFLALVAGRRAVAKSEEAFADAGRELDDRVLEFAWAQPTLRGAGVGTGTLDGVLRASRRRGLRLLAWQIPGDTLFSVVLQLVLLAFGATTVALYLSGDLEPVAAAAMIVVLLRIVETTGSLSLLSTPSASAARVLTSVRELVTEHQAAGDPRAGVVRGTGLARGLRADGLDFTYPDGTRALREVDADFPAGAITVIVGGSGSGKSTLLDVLSGLREPTGGAVLADGVPAAAPDRLAEASVVFQTTQLRPGTLRENIGAVDDAALPALAERAQLTELVETLPAGWDSRVGESANALSGGERQRVGLARALAKPAGVLLVDEATSALDAITERAVVDALEQVRGERTTVIVTHRPALVALADQVIVLDDGRVVDSGNVEQLLARGGVFADLWTRWRQTEGWQV